MALIDDIITALTANWTEVTPTIPKLIKEESTSDIPSSTNEINFFGAKEKSVPETIRGDLDKTDSPFRARGNCASLVTATNTITEVKRIIKKYVSGILTIFNYKIERIFNQTNIEFDGIIQTIG